MIALIAAACAGLAAWCSIGALAVTGIPGGELVRVGLLPPLWLLPVLMAGCAAAAWFSKLSTRASLPLFSSLLLVLPWIPGHVPAAFLIWTGRIAIGVWVCIAVAMLAAVRKPGLASSQGPFGPGSWTADPHRAPRAAAALAFALYITSAWWISAILPGGDEPNYLLITQSLLKDGDLKIENNQVNRDYSAYFRGNLQMDYLKRGTNGQIYSVHAPGLPAIIAPAFVLGGYRGVVVFLSFVAALGGALMWTSAYRLTESTGAAWFTWAAWALTVPFYFQAFSIFPDGFGATVVLFAAQPLLGKQKTVTTKIAKKNEDHDKYFSSSPSNSFVPSWFLSGVALALLPWLHTRFAIIAVALGGCITLRLLASPEGRSRLPVFLGVPVVSALAWFAFFKVIYGTFDPAVTYNGYTQTEAANILTGLPALFLDQQFGILPYAPVCGCGLVGLAMLARTRLRLAVELALTVLLYLLSSSAYHMWWGGSSAPARFAVPVLPLLMLPAAWFWKSARNSGTRALGFALLVVSVAITAVTVSVDGGQLAYNFRDGFSRLAEWASPLVDLPQALPSFFRQTPLGAVVRALIWLTFITLAWLALAKSEARRWLTVATPLAVALAIMLSSTVGWALQNVAGLTPDTSGLSLLQHVDSRLRPNGFDLTHVSAVRADTLVSRIAIVTPQRRSAPPPETLLLVPDVVPAGTYALVVADPASAAGVATLVIGREAKPVASWHLATDLRDGTVRFELPVDVGSLVVKGDEEAVRHVGDVSLRAVSLVPRQQRLSRDYARRVQVYGPAVGYFFDDEVYLEQPGFWVRGGSSTRVAIMSNEPGHSLQLFLRNAAAINHVTLDIDGQVQTLELQPREEHTVPVSSTSGHRASLIRISSESGFRPSEVEAGSTDTRYLGVWVEFKE